MSSPCNVCCKVSHPIFAHPRILQDCRAATFAVQLQQAEWRFAMELSSADIQRAGNAAEGISIEQGGLQLSAVARYYFN